LNNLTIKIFLNILINLNRDYTIEFLNYLNEKDNAHRDIKLFNDFVKSKRAKKRYTKKNQSSIENIKGLIRKLIDELNEIQQLLVNIKIIIRDLYDNLQEFYNVNLIKDYRFTNSNISSIPNSLDYSSSDSRLMVGDYSRKMTKRTLKI